MLTMIFSSFFLLFFIIVKQWWKSKAPTKNFPPSPPKLPLIGNLHQVITSLPHLTLAKMAEKYGPVMHLQFGQQFVLVVSSIKAAKEVLHTKELNFAQRPIFHAIEIFTYNLSSMIFTPYGDYWREMRKLFVTELLNAKRVQSFRFIREEEAWNLVESIASHEGVAVNLMEKILSFTANVTSRIAFSRNCNDQVSLIMSLLSQGIPAVGGFSLPDLYPSLKFLRCVTGAQSALKKLQKKIDMILVEIINEHKERRKFLSCKTEGSDHEDILDVLLNLQESNQLHYRLEDDNIKALTMDIFSAGSDTSSTTMEWAMSELIKNPRVMKKAQAEIRQAFQGKTKIQENDIQSLNYLKLVIKETLRTHPPGLLIPREAKEKCEIGGYEIPAKARVFVNFWAITRDLKIWDEPESFKPERFEGCDIDFRGTDIEYIPFGAGRRMCPAISFATMNIELALANMLYHFDWKLPDEKKAEDLDMTETFGLSTRKKHSLHLVPTICVPFSG